MTSAKVSKGTLTLLDIGETDVDKQSPETETHNSTSFLSQVLHDINMTGNEKKYQICSQDQTPTPTSHCDFSSNSSVQLYEMKSLQGAEKTPSQIQFRLHKKQQKKRRKEKHCKFSEQVETKTETKNVAVNEKFVELKSVGSLTTQSIPVVPAPTVQSITQSKFTTIRIPTPEPSPEKINEQIKTNSVLDQFKKSFNKISSRKKRFTTDKFTTKENPPSPQSPSSHIEERVEIYYFDHGSAEYFRTTDCPPNVLSELVAQQTTYYATRFWAEVFGSLHIGVTFIITFFLQTYRFILSSIIRSILVGFLQITADYLFKPIITILFNGYIQPPLILFYNIFSSIKDMFEPIAELFSMLLRPIEGLLRAIRFVNINIVKDLRRLNDLPLTKTYIKDV